MSAPDAAIDKMIYGGRIPIQFELSPQDAGANLEPFYLLAPRGGYLTLCSDKITKHFQSQPKQQVSGSAPSALDLQSSEIWFEYQGRALKWNHPIGVLYDSFASTDGLPWRVVVHTSNYPTDRVMRCDGMAAIESHFVGQLKQASFIKHGTTQVEGLQSDTDRRQLWLGLANDDYEQFRRVNEKLMTTKGGNWFKRAPFRVYVVDEKTAEDPYALVDIIEQPFPIIKEDGAPQTLRDLQHSLGLHAGAGQVIVHGVGPPIDTPLQWLAEHLAYPDNILHLVWRPTPSA